MRTKYIVTTTNPDDINSEDYYDDSLENCERFNALTPAMKFYKRLLKRTNMHVYLLEVKCVLDAEGTL